MKVRVMRSIIVAVATLLVAGNLAAQSGGERSRNGSARRVMGNHATAVASLDPVGAVEGWGHIRVRDVELAEGEVQRLVTIHLLSLAPETTYTVTVDGVTVATLTTDTHGDATLLLETPGDALDPVPEELPPAIQLMSAEVVDESGAPTLEGVFQTSSFGANGPKDLVYFERITLDNDGGTLTPRGVAKVAVDADAVETFATHACGLEPDAGYEIRVDAVTGGVVTTDSVGYGSLELKSDGDGDLLPEGLGSVQDFVLVEWVSQANGAVVLSGSFSGESMLGQGPLRDQQGNGPNGGEGGPGSGGGRQGGQGGAAGPYGNSGECDGTGSGGHYGAP